MKLNDFIRVAETKTETPDFKEILSILANCKKDSWVRYTTKNYFKEINQR